MKNLFLTKAFFLILVGISFIGCSSKPTRVELSQTEKNELNTFFTNFSKIYTQPFNKGLIDDKEMIHFGIYYNYNNFPQLFAQKDEFNLSINEAKVSETATLFFGKNISKHQSIEGVEYNSGEYTIPMADGEAYRFSQVEELLDMGDNTFQATVSIYVASTGWTGNENDSPETWKSADMEEDIPVLEGKIVAIIEKGKENNPSGYLLIQYLKL